MDWSVSHTYSVYSRCQVPKAVVGSRRNDTVPNTDIIILYSITTRPLRTRTVQAIAFPGGRSGSTGSSWIDFPIQLDRRSSWIDFLIQLDRGRAGSTDRAGSIEVELDRWIELDRSRSSWIDFLIQLDRG